MDICICTGLYVYMPILLSICAVRVCTCCMCGDGHEVLTPVPCIVSGSTCGCYVCGRLVRKGCGARVCLHGGVVCVVVVIVMMSENKIVRGMVTAAHAFYTRVQLPLPLGFSVQISIIFFSFCIYLPTYHAYLSIYLSIRLSIY